MDCELSTPVFFLVPIPPKGDGVSILVALEIEFRCKLATNRDCGCIICAVAD